MTLAYVFWHWSAEAAPAYAERLGAFHRALAADPPPGFRSSRSFAIDGAPWLPRGAGFEDWYLIDDFAALGALNEAAVAGSRRGPHDGVAALSAGGAGGVYALKAGKAGNEMRSAWFAKPAGMSYQALFERLAPIAERGALWQRQMVLGPAPEFCFRSEDPASLPSEIQARTVACRPI
ncbi:MAG: hypothetical protein ACJ79H_07455 [Myxococcales bacterium]